ncbi:MAG TPA: YraN family protein [Microbacterium sp.]|nr:YraN family protein [Microbacterium sp.]
MAGKDERGRAGEQRAAEYLEARGYTVLDRNWRCAQGELDIVACQGDDLVFLEVKTRRGTGYGHPFEAITPEKFARLHRLAIAWIIAHPGSGSGRTPRIDAIGIVGEDPATGALEHLEALR